MASKVYLVDAESPIGTQPMPLKLETLIDASGIFAMIQPGDRVCIKIHSGEYGNTQIVRPPFYERIVRKVKEAGGKPFLTDTGVNYKTGRNDGVDHYVIAARNGYDYHMTGAPFVVADGLDGLDGEYVEVPGQYLKKVKMGSAIYRSDVLISVDHFTGHPAGIGGSIKNLGMGAVCRETKIVEHRGIRPQADPERCNACGICVKVCAEEAVRVNDTIAVLDMERCVGCGLCVYNCPKDALSSGIEWTDMQPRIAEAAAAVRNHFKEKFAAISVLMDMGSDCDCAPNADIPMAPNLGIAASSDLVALDKACIDLVNQAPHYPGSRAEKASGGSPCDKFIKMRESRLGKTGYSRYYEVAEKLGAGSAEYELVRLPNHRPGDRELKRLLDW